MSDTRVRNIIEAALLAAGRPLDVEQLRELFDEFVRPEPSVVRGALKALTEDYEGRGIELREVASGYRIQVRDAVSAEVSRLWLERPQRYSRALLETLALIAYRQPITRGEIEDVRGVQVNPNIIRTLIERNWVRVIGHRDVPGRPELLATSREFLDYFSLKTLDDLPTLSQLRDVETLGVQLEFAATREDAPPAPLGDAESVDGGDAAEPATEAAADEDGAEREFAAGPDGAKEPFAAKSPGD
jgi:segregation and condensation protein B